MIQTNLFKNINQIDVESLDFSNAVDISTLDIKNAKNLIPGMYYIFKTGGYHYLNNCKQKIPEIYRQPIWPFVLRNMKHPNSKKIRGGYPEKQILEFTINGSLNYQVIYLNLSEGTREISSYEKDLVKSREGLQGKIFTVSRIVAAAFVENENKQKYKIVDHIDGNKVDDRPENLRWTDNKGNGTGTPGGKSDPDKVYDAIKDKNWFNGKSHNMTSNKFIYLNKQKEKQQQISFTFNTDFIKGENNG